MTIIKHFALCAIGLSMSLALGACKNNGTAANENNADEPLCAVNFSADSALASIKTQCDFGARVPGTEAHRRCADYIVEKLKGYGLEVTEQPVTAKRWDGQMLHGRNIIAAYNPDASERILITSHWDSRPWCDADPDSTLHRNTPVMAANDGASGVAVIIELARLLKELKPAVGIDFVCFDLEDCGAPYWGTGDDEGRDWCLGSRHWAEQAAATGYRARYGILLDMVGGRDARFCFEGFSTQYAEPVMHRIWDTASRIGAGNLFLKQDGAYATDDHVNINQIAAVPTVDIIPYIASSEHSFGSTWHTSHDTPENISSETLRLVGQTLVQLISEEQ